MRTIIWVIRLVLYLIGALPDMFRAKKLRYTDEKAFHELVDARVHDWAKKMLSNMHITYDVEGLENIPDRPAVYVPNHQSDWDILIMLGCLGSAHGLVAKEGIKKIPVIRTWMDYLGCVFIDRDDPRKALRAINDAGKQIPEKGRSITIFPEGTRSKGEEVLEFKNGAFKTAVKYKAPLVPISIDGTYRIMEANGGIWMKPAHILITVLPPVETEDLDKTQQKELGDMIRQQIIDARHATREKYKGEK